jgi:hypothetical protein
MLFLTLPRGFEDCESSSNLGPSWKASSADGVNEDRVIALRLIGIIHSEFRDRLVERIVFPEVTCDLRSISRPGMCPRQNLATQFDVFDPVLLGHTLQIHRHLHVA